MAELEKFKMESNRFMEMLKDNNLTPVDYYKTFSEMQSNYNNTSEIPYSVCYFLIDQSFPCEEYYMQMLMDVYAHYSIGDNFLSLLQLLINDGHCIAYQKKTCGLIKDYIVNGYVEAYRGEFAMDDKGNLDYTQSVSYTLNYEQAKFFATRFKMLPLTKSIVYTVKVPVEDVLAYIDREDEIVCLPICMGGKMEVIKEESFL